jgi:hypothetical protein
LIATVLLFVIVAIFNFRTVCPMAIAFALFEKALPNSVQRAVTLPALYTRIPEHIEFLYRSIASPIVSTVWVPVVALQFSPNPGNV